MNDSAEQDTEPMVTIPVRVVRHAQMSDRTFRVLAVVVSHIQDGAAVTIGIEAIAAQAGLSAEAFEAALETMSNGGSILHPVFSQQDVDDWHTPREYPEAWGRLTITYPPNPDDDPEDPHIERETFTLDPYADLTYSGPL